MLHKHNFFSLDTDSRQVFDEHGKELRLTGNAYRVLVFLCANKQGMITDIGDFLDREKDYSEVYQLTKGSEVELEASTSNGFMIKLKKGE